VFESFWLSVIPDECKPSSVIQTDFFNYLSFCIEFVEDMKYELTDGFLGDCEYFLERSVVEGKENFGFLKGDINPDSIVLEGISDPPEDKEGGMYHKTFKGVKYLEGFQEFFEDLIDKDNDVIGHAHTHFTESGASRTDKDFFDKYGTDGYGEPLFSIISPRSIVIIHGESEKEFDMGDMFSFCDDIEMKQDMYRNLREAYSQCLNPEKVDELYERGLEAARSNNLDEMKEIEDEAKELAYMGLWD